MSDKVKNLLNEIDILRDQLSRRFEELKNALAQNVDTGEGE